MGLVMAQRDPRNLRWKSKIESERSRAFDVQDFSFGDLISFTDVWLAPFLSDLITAYNQVHCLCFSGGGGGGGERW